MNIRTNEAGYVTNEHILSSGFKVFETIKGNDMGQSSFSLPQYENDQFKILGGYWNYVIKDLNDKTLWEGWWNSNEEFDETINQLSALENKH
jgi:hypothetical protein